MKKLLKIAATIKVYAARMRKALIPAVATLGLIVGTDAPLYVNVVSLLITLGVWSMPNAARD